MKPKRHALLAATGAALIGLFSFACAKGLDDLEPFPCAEDGTCPNEWTCLGSYGCTKDVEAHLPFPCPSSEVCPSGLACIPGVGCDHPRLDGPCSSGVDCSAAGSGAQCNQDFGGCMPACDSEGSCAEGRVCSRWETAGTCFADCSNGQACPFEFECHDLYYGGRKGCFRPGTETNACVWMDVLDQCNDSGTCPDWSVPCGYEYCPSHSTCAGDDRCECASGYTPYTCDGTSCSDYPEACMNGASWTCRPNASSPGCFDDLYNVSGVCHCVNGQSIPFGCGTTGSCHDWCKEAGKIR